MRTFHLYLVKEPKTARIVPWNDRVSQNTAISQWSNEEWGGELRIKN